MALGFSRGLPHLNWLRCPGYGQERFLLWPMPLPDRGFSILLTLTQIFRSTNFPFTDSVSLGSSS